MNFIIFFTYKMSNLLNVVIERAPKSLQILSFTTTNQFKKHETMGKLIKTFPNGIKKFHIPELVVMFSRFLKSNIFTEKNHRYHVFTVVVNTVEADCASGRFFQ